MKCNVLFRSRRLLGYHNNIEMKKNGFDLKEKKIFLSFAVPQKINILSE